MKKRHWWKWTLAGAIWCGIGTVSMLSSVNYDRLILWPRAAAATVIFIALTVLLRSKEKRAEADAAAALARRKAEQEEELRRSRKEREEAIRRDRERFARLRFPVAGVTFKNDDGSGRQAILREIALNNDGIDDVWFEEEEELGEDSGIRVITEHGCVGYVRRCDKQAVRRFFDKMTNSRRIEVERFENDEGEKIYRADVCITMDREDPGQSWYFDDLQ